MTTTLAETMPPKPATARAGRLAAIAKVHQMAGEVLARLNPASGNRSTVKLSDLDDPTFFRLPSGGEAIVYTIQVLNLPHGQKRKANALCELLRELYGNAGWGEWLPGLLNVFSADDKDFAFDNANGATFVMQFIW